MNFNIHQYKQELRSRSTYYDATVSLEQAIKEAGDTTAFELHKLRTPGVIVQIEIDNLNRAGFPQEKLTSLGQSELLVRAFHAGYLHALKYWDKKIADYYYSDEFSEIK